MNILTEIKQVYKGLYFRPPVIVAGLGRCGTTMFFESLIAYGYRKVQPLVFFQDPPAFRNGNVYKSHDFPPQQIHGEPKIIFLFGDPREIAMSVFTKINKWGRMHHRHLSSDGYIDNTCVIEQDTLQLEKQFEAWYRPQPFSFLSIRIESLYDADNRDRLDEYLGFHLDLPPRRQRLNSWRDHPLAAQFDQTYGNLVGRMEAAENSKIWKPRPSNA